MHFERLEVQNFASYYGEHSIDLACQPEKPVVVVVGGTGYGKTSLFDALNWALYGSDYELQLRQRRHREIVDYFNERALREAAGEDREIEMSSTLYFEHGGAHYYMTQSLSTTPMRDMDEVVSAVASTARRNTALYEITPDGNHQRLEYDKIFLDEILPNNVKDYFLFDGDRIYNLSNPGASQEVRDAIYRVVDLELISNAIDHLSTVATEYRRKAQSQSTDAELTKVQNDYSNAHDHRSELKDKLGGYQAEEQSISSQIKIIEDKLQELPDTSEMQGRLIELRKRLNSVTEDLRTATVELRALCSTASLVLARKPITSLMDELDSRRQKGLIPKKVSQTLLNDLLQLRECLCGTKFEEGDRIYQVLADRLRTEQQRSSGNELLDLLIQLNTASDLIDGAANNLAQKDSQIYDLREARRAFDLAITQIRDELEKLPKEDVARLTQELRQRNDDLRTVTRKQQSTQDQIEQCNLVIDDLNKKRDALSKKQTNVQRLQLREQLAQQAADMLDDMYDDFAEESRKGVEDLTKAEFGHFVRSASGYRVALGHDYDLQVRDSNGNPALQRLSMGQHQCLSLSFITAISRVSEKHPPMAIDMPFGRLDASVHDEVSARLPEITSQLILFLIPRTEWHEGTSANLVPKASHIYELQFDEENRETTIMEVG